MIINNFPPNDTVAEIQAATGRPHEAPGSQPSTKRRAADTLADEDESDDGFEQMDVDRKAADVEAAYAQETEDEEERGTPQPLEDEEGNTTTDDEEEAPVTSQQSVPERAKINTSERQAPAKEAAPPPPRRELPFTRRGPAAQAQAQAQVQHQPETSVAGEETAGETDDDEL